MCNLQPFFPSLERFFQALLTLLFASFQFFSILQVLVRGECGVCLHSAKLLLLFVLFRFPPSCGGAVGGTLSGVHDRTNNARARSAFSCWFKKAHQSACFEMSRGISSRGIVPFLTTTQHHSPHIFHLAFGFLCISS